MCGIFGLIQPHPFETSELTSMSRLLRHRGPDDEGFALFGNVGVPQKFGGIDTPQSSLEETSITWLPHERLATQQRLLHGGLAFGHRRLAIIDLSPQGHQPMCFDSGRYWITYNGEIYNYVELKEELLSVGHFFTTESDTEVLLAAYKEWGWRCLERFNGMWALAIYDRQEKTLFFARDRFGIKPLYFWRQGGRIAFASEIKTFTGLNGWRARADKNRLLDFLVWNVLDHTESTMFDGVRQLLPGNYALLNLSGVFEGEDAPELRFHRWYSLPNISSSVCGSEAVEGLYSALVESVKLRLRADVPVGSCLSGGLDSSAIVALMADQLGSADRRVAPLHTFSARSSDSAFDEYRFAQSVIESASATSHTVVPEPSCLFENIDRLTWHQDEPFVSTSVFAQWCVFQLAQSAGVKVMLDGQGADEILGGYRGFFGAHLASMLRSLSPLAWWNETVALKREAGFSISRSAGYTIAYLFPSLLGLLGRFDRRAYADREWLVPQVWSALNVDPLLRAGGRPCSVREMSLAQVSATNLPMLLHWEDRNSMAHSIEARVPFLDYRVVEHCLSMADAEKVGGGIAKRALRAAMRGKMPNLVLDRRDKMGFVTAESLWVRRDEPIRFRAEVAEALNRLPSILSPNILKQFDEVLAGNRPFDHRYWRAVSVSRWARVFDVEIG